MRLRNSCWGLEGMTEPMETVESAGSWWLIFLPHVASFRVFRLEFLRTADHNIPTTR